MKKLSKTNKIILIAALLILVVTISISTYAIYKSRANGNSDLKTAAWKIKLNGENIVTNNTFTFDLKDADWTHTTNITPNDDTVTVIAPGSVGTYGIEIDTTGTEVDVEYSITAIIKQNDTEIDLNTLNENFTIGVYSKDTLMKSPAIGSINAGEKENLEIRIIWNEIDSLESNILDVAMEDNLFSVEVTISTYQKILSMCRRATELHSAICVRNDTSGCGYNNKYEYGETITYGQLGSGETLQPGDAFDCDVNNDGVYNPETERFYYVTSNEDNAILIYYSNVTSEMIPSNMSSYVMPDSNFMYESNQQNYLGPTTCYTELPSTTDWSNPKLILPGTRQITNELGGTTTNNNRNTIESFTYTDKAARLLTTQELKAGCPTTVISISSVSNNGTISDCTYLLENTNFDRSYKYISGTTIYETGYSYWLETPYSKNGVTSFHVSSSLGGSNVSIVSGRGVRPVIEVRESDLDLNYKKGNSSIGSIEPGLSPTTNGMCKRVTNTSDLHTETCTVTQTYGCNASNSVGNGNTITYGHAKEIGSELVSGDAFDCDVNNNGIIDKDSNGKSLERFYYVSDYYDEKNNTFDRTKAALIYYTNVGNGAPYSTQETANDLGYECEDENGCNWYGPIDAYTILPSITEWSNPKILMVSNSKYRTREIIDENGFSSGTFTYTNKAARLITFQELMAGCGRNIKSGTAGSLEVCNYLFEDTNYENIWKGSYYWFETPTSNMSDMVLTTDPTSRNFTRLNIDVYAGVRPVITVSKNNIEY